MRPTHSFLLFLALTAIGLGTGLVTAGCTSTIDNGGSDASVPDVGADSAAPSGLPVGSACAADSQCAGPGVAECVSEFRPLASFPDGGIPDNLRSIGLVFPGGYCSTKPNCRADADCGRGGTCFWPLKDVTPDTLSMLGRAINADLTSFGQYAVCLQACKDVAECRPGYVCTVPLNSLLALVKGADLSRTFCIGDPICAMCDAHAKCLVDNLGKSGCVCNAGYSGDGKTCAPVCAPACGANAHCDDKGMCACNMGFTGNPQTGCTAVVDPCLPNPCMNQGTCAPVNGTFACTCLKGYSGMKCETPINACLPNNPCMNGGTCAMTGPGTYSCACPKGYTGVNCETVVNGCVPNPCMNGGTCAMAGPGAYTCACKFGYTGINCQDAVNACAPNPCMNGGTCGMTGPGLYSCACPMGFTGMNCQTVVSGCLPVNPCVHGTCANVAGGKYSCTCDPGYIGVNCDMPINACLPNNPCMNGGTCGMTGPNTYVCTCAAGYSGTNCQTAINACLPNNPCMNGGTCAMSGPGTYTCACVNGYTGMNCQTAPALTYCDVVYRLDPAPPSAASQFRVANTGLGAQDAYHTVGTNASTPTAVTTPFTPAAFPTGFLRLRFPSVANAPAAGAVQLIEYYQPIEFAVTTFGTTVTTNVDQSVGLLTTTAAGCPTANYDRCLPAGTIQTLSRPCVSAGSGTLAGTTLTWGACSLMPPAPPAPNPAAATAWSADMSQIAPANKAANPGCIENMSVFGNVTCAGGFCGAVPAGTLGVQNSSFDQKFNSFVFSSTNYATATISLAESTLPAPANVYDSIRWAAAVPVSVTCAPAAMMTCQ